MEGAEQAHRQREQLERYLQWTREEDGVEGPTHLDTWFKPHQQERLQWLKAHCVGRIMELGCNYAFALAYCGGHIGVDWNEKNIALARILSPKREFVVADIRHLPFPDGYVDTVMACECFEHLAWQDVPKALEEAKRVARRKVLITMPDGEKGTPEALSMKHQFLFTKEKRMEFLNMVPPWGFGDVSRNSVFLMMELICPD